MAGFLSASNGDHDSRGDFETWGTHLVAGLGSHWIKGEVSILHVFIPFLTHLEMPDPEWPAIVHPTLSRRNLMKADRRRPAPCYLRRPAPCYLRWPAPCSLRRSRLAGVSFLQILGDGGELFQGGFEVKPRFIWPIPERRSSRRGGCAACRCGRLPANRRDHSLSPGRPDSRRR